MNASLRIQVLLCLASLVFPDGSYFPVRTKPGEEGLTSFAAKWYSESLARMKEPRLPELAHDPNVVIYRFLILPTWGNSIAVRVQKQEGIYVLSARRLDSQAGYDPGKLVEQKDIRLSEADSQALEMLVTNLKFFEMPTDEKIRGFDGDEWILESAANGKYHVVQRWCASSYDPKKRGLTEFLSLLQIPHTQICPLREPEESGPPHSVNITVSKLEPASRNSSIHFSLRSASMGPPRPHETGHFYFAQTGHSHFAATSTSPCVDFSPRSP